jgi:hypothetical protein
MIRVTFSRDSENWLKRFHDTAQKRSKGSLRLKHLRNDVTSGFQSAAS